MTNYVFIESRDPFESPDVRFVVATATALKRGDNKVTVFLVQNAVLACRQNAGGSQIPQMAESGITLLADEFSLSERGIQPGEMAAGVRPSSIEALVELLVLENTKAIWH